MKYTVLIVSMACLLTTSAWCKVTKSVEDRLTQQLIIAAQSRNNKQSLQPILELLDAGARVDSLALHMATGHGDVNLMRLLLKRGASVNHKDSGNWMTKLKKKGIVLVDHNKKSKKKNNKPNIHLKKNKINNIP